ncbi:1,4-alpha-glucan branching protein GlgB [Pusillimonas sp.]|uniref:1,4-alpha-glucan branching protein GlgB n=1 Tax=Pusillimonas sp. TaxID=3040095 RepID=UPI0029A72B0F|nr:1,4-alpha-glucan branching protein GlgB [Pusillimonas sp.]MDX3894183.1 1,4-alpha-glucan branching protein GlgB [Pusillimonas sp.]
MADERIAEDFGPLLGELDIHLLAEGRHEHLADCLGAHPCSVKGVTGTRFAVWAPNARSVSVVGDFNSWNGQRHRMRLRPECGVWEMFAPGVGEGALYKFEIVGRDGQLLPQKADPVARRTELPPATASVVASTAAFEWSDEEWLARRGRLQAPDAPISIYEVHMGSWRPATGDRPVWRECGSSLIDYARSMGFTHIELLPVMEHPFGGSWGYQPLGLFAPSARWGAPEDFAWFVNACHRAGLGVILDWVPAHFPSDPHGLAWFDGTALYEHADPRQGRHPDWDTLIYNFGRNEVRNFLVASALEWVRRYHVDGLRVDAVASMLYLDYSRQPGEWTPNRHGGRENLEAVDFLRELNDTVRRLCPGAIMVAEESTAWPGVTAATRDGGLGFDYKWNMGWMHDSLRYMSHESVHRKYHHDDMTFGTVYAWTERFILPLSHDEVVHGKASLLGKMPGDRWQRFANLRAYYAFMWTHPGRKLLFMGGELGQETEWNHDAFLDWGAPADPLHAGVQLLVKDLNALYGRLPALHESDGDPEGFGWLIGDDRDNSVFAFERRCGGQVVLVVCNMTPVPRQGYRIGASRAGRWREVLNSDAAAYGGSDMGNAGEVRTLPDPAHGQPQSLTLVLPPLAALILVPEE